ncbi:MAG: MFS transporter, partial [Chloroflexi bacterium]
MTSLFFATFAAMQIPLGVWLDKWGARRVTPGLMVTAVIGSILFATGTGFTQLAIGRALIGIGMAGVLMGSLKIFSQWFSAERYATATGLLVGLGASGALFAATPLAQLNRVIGWRMVFWIGAGVTAVIILSILLWARDTPPGRAQSSTTTPTGSLRDVFGDARLWRIIPLNFFLAGTLLSFQGLWAGPYLFDVLQLNDIQAGNVLLWLSGSAVVGYVIAGWLADLFGLARMVVIASIFFVLSQFILAFHPPQSLIIPVYALFGFTGGFNVIIMAHVRHLFPLHLTGKAVTAVNLFGIGGTFLLQWWGGLIVDLFPRSATGQYPPQAYTAALLVTAVGGLLTLFWYLPLVKTPD